MPKQLLCSVLAAAMFFPGTVRAQPPADSATHPQAPAEPADNPAVSPVGTPTPTPIPTPIPAPAPDPIQTQSPEGPTLEVHGELSNSGTDRGILEYSLAGVTGATAIGLVVAGAITVKEWHRQETICEGSSDITQIGCAIERPVLLKTSAILSYTVSALLFTAAGLLLRQGVRVNRDFRAYHRQAAQFQLSVTALTGRQSQQSQQSRQSQQSFGSARSRIRPHGGQLQLRLRF